MGFFHAPQLEIQKPKRAPKEPRDLSSMTRGCDGCSLKANWSWITTPQMPISGNIKDADILVLGEGPGEAEDRDGMAFVGPSGHSLRVPIPGHDLDRLAFQNIVRCRPRDNATPSTRDCHACSIYLEEDIERLPIKAILGVGGVPLNQFYPSQNITRIHGVKFPIEVAGKVLWYYPILHPSFGLRTGGDRSPATFVMHADIKRFFKEVDKWPKPKIWKPDPTEILCPTSEAEARAYFAEMKAPYGIDLETHKLKPYLKGAKLLTASISDDEIAMAFPIEHPEAPNTWGLRLLLEVAGAQPWIAHNAAFELVWMLYKAREAGIDWKPAPFEDSMACGRLYHARETILSLDMLTRMHLGINIKEVSKVNLNNMIEEPLERILPYNGLDAQSSARLWRILRPQIDATNYNRFIESIHSTSRMELMGLEVDKEVSYALKAEWEAKKTGILEKVKSIYEVKAFERERQIEFNIASPDHVGIALTEYGKVTLPKTSKKGESGKSVEGEKWSTSDDDLRANAKDNPLAEGTIDFRECQLHLSTFIDGTIAYCDESSDDRPHPSYTTMHTATTRLSCEKPNGQNYPKRRHRAIRRQFIPDRLSPDNLPKDHVFIAADLGQIDARIYGCATKDRALCQSFIDREDIHIFWRDRALSLYPAYLERLARQTNEKNEAKILKGARDIIKSDFVFATLYGSSPGACAERTGIPLSYTTELVGELWQKYPDALKWVKRQRAEYSNTGSIRTLCGVERHGLLWGNEVINNPIQGSTAHIVNDAQNALSRLSIEQDDLYLHPRLNIHDDVTFVAPDDEEAIERYIKLIAAEMVRVRYEWQVVPFTVEFKIGYNWADLSDVCVIEGEYNA